MATMNFSIPDDVKMAFNEAFAGENKSEVVTQLLRQATEDKLRRNRRAAAVDAIVALRAKFPVATDRALRKSRVTGRP